MASSNGKFLIYKSPKPCKTEQTCQIIRAVHKIAEKLNLSVQFPCEKPVFSTQVYYQKDGGPQIPLYSDWRKSWEEEEIYQRLKNMVYTLSFHPDYSCLQPIRKR